MLRLVIILVLLVCSASAFAAPSTQPDQPVNTWVLRHTDGPNITWENGIAYDPATHLIAWYGGHAWGYPQSNYTHLYDLQTNTWRDSQAPYRPQRRCLVMLNYIDSCGKMITTQGGTGHGSMSEGGFAGEYKKIFRSDPRGPWLYDVAADHWENCRTLPPIWKRVAHAQCAYDASTDALVWIAGDKLGLYCPRTNRVSYRDLPKELHNRLAYGIAADPVMNCVVIFGGTGPEAYVWSQGDRSAAYEKFVHNDTWLYSVADDKWQKYVSKVNPPKGMPLHDHRFIPMVYHDKAGVIIMQQQPIDNYETDTSKWSASEFWYLDLFLGHDGWKRLDLKNPPPFLGLLTYASNENLLVLVGGGKDGEVTGEAGKKYFRPSLSKQLWTCRVDLPGARKRVDRRPNVSVVTLTDSIEVSVQLVSEFGSLARAEVDARTGFHTGFRGIDTSTRVDQKGGFKFVDKDIKRGRVYAYATEESVEDGVEIFSPPAFNQPWRPSGLVASVESDKKVVLRWNANSEKDLAGYKVYRAAGAEVETGEGKLLTEKPIPGQADSPLPGPPPEGRGKEAQPGAAVPQFTDETVDLSDGVARIYWVTAVNKGGVESGASPLAYTFPDPATALNAKLSEDKKTITVTWDWPKNVDVAGFNVYHLNNHWNTHGEPAEKVKAWYESWKPITDKPIPPQPGAAVPHPQSGAAVPQSATFTIPVGDNAKHHYFYVRAVNVLGQEGFYTDIVSATDRRFHP